jgi:SdrD B-like domain
VNRPLLVRALTVFNRFQGRHGKSTQRRKASRRWRQTIFERCEDRSLLAGASITGIKFATASPNGFGPGDVPLGGVFVDLYKDNGDGVLNTASDSLADRQQTAAGTGAYTFANVADGHYFIQEEVPVGYVQSAGPLFYTVDVIGGAVYSANTLNIDSFSDPDPAASWFISALNPNPYFRQDSGAGVLGGQRDLLINVLGAPNPISASGFVGTVSLNNGVFNLATATNGPGTAATMQYDGTDVDTSALNNAHGLSADLTANGNNGIRLDFNFLQVGVGTTMNFTINATSPGGGTAVFNGVITQSPSGFSLFVPFSSFATAGTFTFANVDSLQFTFNPTGVQDADFEINQIVGANQNNTGFNFGNFAIAVSSISGLKYVDSNNNANHDPGELPIGGVIITLTGTTNTGNPVSIQTQTAADGTFSFINLQPGTYTLTETPPINFIIGQPKIGSAGGVIVSPLVMSNIVLPGSTNAVNYQFGELGLTPPFVSKRLLLDPAQPVVLTAVYSTTATTNTASVKATTTANVATPTVKKAAAPVKKPAAKPAVKIPLYVPPKKKKK